MRPGNRIGSHAAFTLLFLFLVSGVGALLLASPPHASAAGGSGPPVPGGTGAGNQELASPFVTVNAGSTGTTAAVQDVYQNDYILVPVAFEGIGQHVNNVVDNDSNSYSQVGSSATNNGVELWCARMTHATGGLTVTVTSSASATYSFQMIPVAGINSCTTAPGMAQSNHGSTAAASVGSFTPTTGDFCEVVVSEHAGASATWTDVNPFEYVYQAGLTVSSTPITGNYYLVDAWRGSWNANDGATTATVTPSASSSPAWDEIVDCLPTSSAGNEIYAQQGPRGGIRSGGSSQGEGVDPILKGDYAVQFTGIEGTSVTVSSISDTNGGSDTWSKVASSDVHNDAEIWITQAAVSSSGTGGFGVNDVLSGNCGTCVVLGWNIAGISSTTAQVFTNSGTASTVTIGSSTPNANDMCLAFAIINTGTASATFSTPGDTPWRLASSVDISGNYYEVILMRPDWPSGVSTTAQITPSSTSSPSWDEVVTCLPGTVSIPLTCTMANSAPIATLSLSESSGNALSPGTVACDGSSHSITADPSVTLTATEPVAGANTRDMFSGGGTTTTDSACASSASGQCPAWQFTNYDQLLNTYQATPHLKNWDNGLSIVPTGTILGVAGSSVCTISPAGGTSNTAACSGWSDYNMPVTFPPTATGAPLNTQWQNDADGNNIVTPSSGGNTYTEDYYDQLQNTYQASPFAPSTWDVSGLSLDGSSAVVCTSVASCQTSLTTSDTNDLIVAFCAGNAGQTGFSISDGSSLTWHQRGSVLTGAGADVIEVYYATSATKLSSDLVTCTNVPSGSHNIVVSVFGVNGANLVTPFDSNSNIPNTNSAVASTTPSCTMTTSNPNDLLFTYLGHSGNTVQATPSGFTTIQTTGGSPSSQTSYELVASTQSSVTESWSLSSSGHWATWCDAIQSSVVSIVVTGTSTGSAGQTICIMPGPVAGTSTAASCSGFTDYNTAVTMGVLTVSANERWSPITLTYTDTTGGNTHTDNYYEQLQNTYQATPNAQPTWDNGLTAQGVVGTLLGTSGQTICSITLSSGGGAQNCVAYADYNTAVVIGSATIGGAPANSQWLRSGTCSFTQTTSGNTNNCNYYKQLRNTYQVTSKYVLSANTLTLDGSASNAFLAYGSSGPCGSATSCSATLTTSHTTDIIVAYCFADSGAVLNTPSDTAGLTWTQRGSTYSGFLRGKECGTPSHRGPFRATS